MSKDNNTSSIFFPWLSHNIRQPLNSVFDAIALLMQKDLSLTQNLYLGAISDKTNELLMLINDILDLTRIEEGNFNPLNERFDLRAAAQSVAGLLSKDALYANIDFEYYIHPEVHTWVRGDVGRFRQVFTNIGWLALNQSRESAIVMDVTMEEENVGNVLIHCTINDAISRPSKKLLAFLDQCEKGESIGAIKENPEFCLRVMLSKRLVEMMGGKFVIESFDSAGASYRFSARFEKSVIVAGDETERDAELSDIRILLVDGDDESRAKLTDMMQGWGAKALPLPHCDAAFLRLRETAAKGNPFDIVLISTQLDSQEAENFGRAMKNDPLLKDIPLILAAPVGRRGDAARLQQVGFSGYLTRPFSAAQVRRCVKYVLKAENSVDAGQAPVLVTRHLLTELSRSHMRAIIVEDNTVHQLALKRMLEKLGYYPEVVAEPDMAIITLEEHEYDLAFLDLSLKGFNGKRAAKIIREKSGNAFIVGLLNRKPKNDGKGYLESGFSKIIVRPIKEETLVELLENAVAQMGEK